MSTVASTKETMTNEGSRILFIRKAEIVTIAPTEKSKFCLKITVGNKKHKTEEIKIDGGGAMPKWTKINMNVGDLDPQTVVSCKLYGRRRLRLKVLGSAKKTLGGLFEGSSTSADIQLYDGTCEIAVLKIYGSNNARELMDELVPITKKPSENYKFLESSETLGKVFDAAKGMVDTLAGVHPAATIAWGLLSVGFEVLKKQHDMNQAVLDLYAEMISVYDEASKNDVLQKRDGLRGTYSSLFKQTIECAMFIEGYAKKSAGGRVFAMDISPQAAKFHQAFGDLKDQLIRGFARESVVVTLGIQELVNIQIIRDRLRDLQPSQELGPKSKCMQGTREATINTIISWIAQCDGGVMWCKGLAGTGKSSLMGTLHDLLTADIGGRSRLAAFIRYDRLEYSNADKLINSIAYALGTFDLRIGMTISKVIEGSRTDMTMLDLSERFRRLLRGPLERVPDLADEGPLVVIIDGLDECDASPELLTVLAEGFGPQLPFMRLILSSRPILRMTTAFEGRDHIHPLYLDTTSEYVNRDIRFYFEREFATILPGDVAFHEKCRELDAVNELAARASGLFIWAATVAKFICPYPAISRLQALLATDISHDATTALTTLYHTALNTLVSEIGPGANADIRKYVCNVLGAVLAGQTPPGMTEDVLDYLVRDEGDPPSSLIVSMLGSVLSPETEGSPIQIIHKSLDDFLRDQSRCGDEWFIDVNLHRRAIAEQCQVASKSFMQTWSPTSDIGTVPTYISKYALFGVFWYSVFDASDLERFTSFFCHFFLPWLNVVATDDAVLHFEITDTICQQHGLTRMPLGVDIRDSLRIHDVLQSSAAFYSLLHSASEESSLAGNIALECREINVSDDFDKCGPLEAMGNNLCMEGTVFVNADETTEYGFTFVNTTPVPLYVSMFLFDISDLSIVACYQPKRVNGGVFAPLSPGESLPIEYASEGGSQPHMYLVPEGQEVDISFLKLFFSTDYLDLSAIAQESPFSRRRQTVLPSVKDILPYLCHTMSVPIIQKKTGGSR